MRSIVFAFAFVVSLVPVHARAQERRVTFSAIGGHGKTYDDEGGLGHGWLAGAALDRVLFGGASLEVSVETLSHNRSEGYFLSEGRTTIGGVSLLPRFGRSGLSLYGLAGLTVGHHSGTNVVAGVRRSLSSTDPGFRIGGGLAIHAGPRFEISPEFRLNGFFADDGGNPAFIPSFGIRVGWRM